MFSAYQKEWNFGGVLFLFCFAFGYLQSIDELCRPPGMMQCPRVSEDSFPPNTPKSIHQFFVVIAVLTFFKSYTYINIYHCQKSSNFMHFGESRTQNCLWIFGRKKSMWANCEVSILRTFQTCVNMISPTWWRQANHNKDFSRVAYRETQAAVWVMMFVLVESNTILAMDSWQLHSFKSCKLAWGMIFPDLSVFL